MVKFMLPTIEPNIIDGQLVRNETEIECELDMSLNSQIKWETQFSAQAEHENLFDYAERLQNNNNSSVLISKLKVIYCWLNSSKFNTFTDFLKMFDYTDIKFFKKLVDSISQVFKIVLSANAAKN